MKPPGSKRLNRVYGWISVVMAVVCAILAYLAHHQLTRGLDLWRVATGAWLGAVLCGILGASKSDLHGRVAAIVGLSICGAVLGVIVMYGAADWIWNHLPIAG